MTSIHSVSIIGNHQLLPPSPIMAHHPISSSLALKSQLDHQAEVINQLVANSNLENVKEINVSSNHRIKEFLYEKLQNYKPPRFDSKAYSQYQQQVLSELRQRHYQKKDHFKKLNMEFHDSFIEDVKGFKLALLKQEDTTFAYNWLTNSYFSEPIEYTSTVELTPFMSDIRYYSDSMNLNLAATLSVLLDRCQQKGFSVKQLKLLFHKLIIKFIPELSANADSALEKEHVYPMFKLLVEHIDIPKEKMKIKEARARISRSPGQDIQQICDRLAHILYQQVHLNNPSLKEEEIVSSAETLIIAELKHFITPLTHKMLEDMTNMRTGYGEKVTLIQILRSIKDIESSTPDAAITKIMQAPSANDGVLQTALAAAKVNQIATSGSQGRYDRGKSPGRANGYQKQNYNRQNGRSSSMSRNSPGSRNYSNNNQRQSSNSSFKKSNSNYDNRPRSPSPFNRGGSPRTFGDSRQQKGSGWQSSNRQRSSSPFQRNTRSRSSSFNRGQQSRGRSFSKSPGRNDNRQARSQSRGRSSYSSSRSPASSSRHQSPVSFRKQDSNDKYNKVLYCNRCGSNTHSNGSCFRYKYEGKMNKPCYFCAKNGRQLFHEEQYCRFKQSKYQSPNRNSKN